MGTAFVLYASAMQGETCSSRSFLPEYRARLKGCSPPASAPGELLRVFGRDADEEPGIPRNKIATTKSVLVSAPRAEAPIQQF